MPLPSADKIIVLVTFYYSSPDKYSGFYKWKLWFGREAKRLKEPDRRELVLNMIKRGFLQHHNYDAKGKIDILTCRYSRLERGEKLLP